MCLYYSEMVSEIDFWFSRPISSSAINALMASAWPRYSDRDWDPVLARSLEYVCAFFKDELIGFVNVAWDGGQHAFLLDTTVHPSVQRRGIGTALVDHAVQISRDKGVEWLHVDFEPKYASIYLNCGFRPTEAGLIKICD